jgi:type I restriction enzyme M protein
MFSGYPAFIHLYMANDQQSLKDSLWAAADKLLNNMSPADYKYVVLGLIFLKYISDAFDEQYSKAQKEGFDPEDRVSTLRTRFFESPRRRAGMLEGIS